MFTRLGPDEPYLAYFPHGGAHQLNPSEDDKEVMAQHERKELFVVVGKSVAHHGERELQHPYEHNAKENDGEQFFCSVARTPETQNAKRNQRAIQHHIIPETAPREQRPQVLPEPEAVNRVVGFIVALPHIGHEAIVDRKSVV